MKTMYIRSFYLTLTLCSGFLNAQSETVVEPKTPAKIFQQALYAEEVAMNNREALDGYKNVLERYYELRKMAATSALRSGIVERKRASEDNGKLSRSMAVKHFQQVVREFPEFPELNKSARENLTSMGESIPDKHTETIDLELQEIARIKLMFKNKSPGLASLPSPLAVAARNGQLSVAEFLINKGVDVNRGEKSKSPLSIAVFAGDLNMVEFLIKSGADLNPQSGTPPLSEALTRGHPEIVEVLLKAGANPRYHNKWIRPPLHQVIRNSNLDVKRKLQLIELLVEYEADPSALDASHHDATPLHWAAKSGDTPIVDYLISIGADVDNLMHETGETPLIMAANKGHLDIMKSLLNHGADHNISNTERDTALGQTVVRENIPALQLLLDFSANPSLFVKPGRRTPIYLALDKAWDYPDRKDKVINMLLDAGADPNMREPSGIGKGRWTTLHAIVDSAGHDSGIAQRAVENCLLSLPVDFFDRKILSVTPSEIFQTRPDFESQSPMGRMPWIKTWKQREAGENNELDLAVLKADFPGKEIKILRRHSDPDRFESVTSLDWGVIVWIK